MNEKLTSYVNGVFAPYEGVKSAVDLKADLLADLQEKYRELKAEGMDDEAALRSTIDSIGDIEQTVQEVASLSRSLERQVLTNFSGSSLAKSDFAGVTAQKGKFEASDLRGSDFSGADLTGSSFKASDAWEANFDRANLTDCIMSACDFRGASFDKTILVRTAFNTSTLTRAKFTGVKLIDVKFIYADIKDAIFENCVFSGVDFESDLRGLCFDGQTFVGVKFGKSALKCFLSGYLTATCRNI